jgi:Skp family chaperone for outer membrane proteins
MRKLLGVSGVLLLGAVFLVGRSWSDARPPVPKPQSKTALVNLTYVIKNHEKFKTLDEELKAVVKPYQVKDTNFKTEAKTLTREAEASGTTVERREQIQHRLKELEQALTDNRSKAQRAVGKKREHQLKMLYTDIKAATQRYAKAHGLDLVLHYHDALTNAELNSGPNLARKVQSDGLMPLYAAPGVDISKEIVTALNDSLPKKKGE